MDSPSYQPGHRRAASTSRATGALYPHTHGELRAREKLQANTEAIVDAWLRNHAPPQSAFRLPPSVTFHTETTARNAPGMAVSSVPSGTALPESAGASSAHFVEPPAQDQAASDDAVTPGAAGPDAADPVSHASRDFLYFPAAEGPAVTPSAIRPHPEHRCEESVLDSGADSGETDIAPCALGAPAGPPPAPDSPNFSRENTVGELEGLRLSSAAEGSPAIQVPSSVAGSASQRDHEKSDLDLEAPHYPEGPFHETENTPPHPPASAGATTMAEDGDTGTVDCGAPVSTGTGGSRPPATAFLRDPATSGTAPAKRQQKRRKNTKASRRQRPSVQPRTSPPSRPHTGGAAPPSLNSVPPGASAVPGSLVDAQPAASTSADPQETGGEFQLVRLPKLLSGRSWLSPAEGPEHPRPMRARCAAPAPPWITPHRHHLPASSSQVELWEGMVFTLEDPRKENAYLKKWLFTCPVRSTIENLLT
ncbi:hypothetical protein HPB50_012814 [Hyalomma asiaticum]|uniref:Uncharacterized protein n=1 Tax=Hyalomma asiaticum TaxID=266040 RepID=A0ACB7STP2_HYAAI|nr:hypothetical protein HPB50_012814 [Hyalomma asiaticum]